MATKYVGGIISKTAPTVTPPVGGEGGSASGVWTMEQALPYIRAGTWPQPVTLKGLWAWGKNDFGMLGLGNTTYFSSPKQVGALTDWLSISTCYVISAAVKTNGTLWTWGRNQVGQLGLGNLTNYSSPKQVGALTNWLSVSCGYYNTLAIKANGTIWSWGRNNAGQLGLGNTTNYSSPKQIGALADWASVYMFASSALAVKSNGTLWAWGVNNQGQLGLGNTVSYSSPKQVGLLTDWRVLSPTLNSQGISAVKTNGTLWTWGQNSQGQLGLGNTAVYSSPKQVGSLTTWDNVSSSNNSALAVKTNGTLWGWGINANGQLGLGNTTYAFSSPVQVGALTDWLSICCSAYASIGIKTNGTLWAWGRNLQGQLGLGNTTAYSSPKQVGSLTTWKKVSAEKAVLALKS